MLLCDDMRAAPTLLEAHFRRHEQHPEPHVVVEGKVLQSPDLPLTVFHRNWDPFRLKSLEAWDELPYLKFCGCHVSFKKQFMLNSGLYIENRPAAAFEDIEVAWRLRRNGGMRLLYAKEALAYHHHVETIDSASRRALKRGLNFDLLTDHINDPRIWIHYHYITLRTLPSVLRFFRGPKEMIMDEDRNVAWYFAREVIRRVVFNPLTVPYLFLPLIRRAEQNCWLALLIRPLMLRGVVSYHFLKGVKELNRRRRGEATRALGLRAEPPQPVTPHRS